MSSVDMMDKRWMTFPALEKLSMFRHRFTLRHPDVDVNVGREEVISRLLCWHREHTEAMGLGAAHLCTADQVHGKRVAVVTSDRPPAPFPATDGLVSVSTEVVIGIYVADCCAVYLADPVTGAFGVVHAGKIGSAAGITGEAIRVMKRSFGTDPQNIVVQLSPCIRPPAYEIDFAATIRLHALQAGILPQNLHDSGICTSSDSSLFYSYRMEKGRTGRMLALLGRKPALFS